MNLHLLTEAIQLIAALIALARAIRPPKSRREQPDDE